MAEPADIVDFDALMMPIPGVAPVGEDLRGDASPESPYTRLRDARGEARAAERSMEAEAGDFSAPPQWRTIRELAVEALTTRSKDLEIAAWLTEALVRSDGLRGLAAGLEVMAGLVERYWETMFPVADEDGIETRVAPVATLNGRSGDGALVPPLRRIVLFDRPDGAPLQFWQYEQSVDLAGIVDEARRKQRVDQGAILFDTLESEAQLAGIGHFAELSRQAGRAAEGWRALAEALEARAGSDAPPTSRVRDLLNEISGVVARFAGPAAADGTASASQISPAEAEPDGAAAPAVNRGVIASRADALRALAEIAAYFRRAEPLSPLAYTLEEVVRRAGMTWPQLLEEIIPDPAARAQVLNSLGIRPPPAQ